MGGEEWWVVEIGKCENGGHVLYTCVHLSKKKTKTTIKNRIKNNLSQRGLRRFL